jgi:hypothetical protein
MLRLKTAAAFRCFAILLGETDSYSSLPMSPDHFEVRCDSCGKEYSYKEGSAPG